jgi:hypothetical protein
MPTISVACPAPSAADVATLLVGGGDSYPFCATDSTLTGEGLPPTQPPPADDRWVGMSQPVDTYHRAVWADLQEPDPFVQVHGAPPGKPSSPAPAACPNPPNTPLRTSLLGRATGTPPVTRTPAQIQTSLDAFADSLCSTFHTADGDFPVQTPYRANVGPPVPAPGSRAMTEVRSAALLLGMTDYALHAVIAGKGSPQQIHDLTQGLIDRGCLPVDSRPAHARITEMMYEHGIGLDGCAYVCQAFLAATGLSPAQAHFAPTLNEGLYQLGARGFARVSPSTAQPGDIIVLGRATPNGSGFRGIVYDAHPSSQDELRDFAGLIEGQGVPPCSGHVTAFFVDSSWGPDGDCDDPGVGRNIWYYDEVSKVWATMGSPNLVTRSMPFGRPLEGIYRFVGP